VLTNQQIGAVLVRGAAGKMLGITSERDIVRCLVREGGVCLEKTAAQVMTRVLQTVGPTTTTD